MLNSYLNITHNAMYMYIMFPNKLHVYCLQINTTSFNTLETHCNLTIKKQNRQYIYIYTYMNERFVIAKWHKTFEILTSSL